VNSSGAVFEFILCCFGNSPEYIDPEKRWNDFWDKYFRKDEPIQPYCMKSALSPHSVISFWMQDDFLKVWNISGIADDGRRVKLVNKTRNGLECYNRHFNGIVSTAHPNLVTFVQAL
jgi:hypothetical protein